MRIKVHFFDEEKFMSDWMWYSFKSNGHDSYQAALRFNIISPLDRNWNDYFIEREIETSKYVEFTSDGHNFVEVDDDYMFIDGYDNSLYSFSGMRRKDDLMNKIRITPEKPWFTPGIKKMIARDEKLSKILKIADEVQHRRQSKEHRD